MATYSTNTTLKVNAAISSNSGTRTGAGTYSIYTSPANGYSVVNVFLTSSGPNTSSVEVVGATIFYQNTSSSWASSAGSNTGTTGYNLFCGQAYLGPGQTISLKIQSITSGAVRCDVSGVEFLNS
jgi:hypothetical protein